MLRAIWFLLKVGIVAAAAVWLVHQPGEVAIVWRGYLIETSASFLVLTVALLFLLWTFAYRLWRAFVAVPDVYRRYKISAAREQGYRAVTDGLVAIAAGDGVAAEKYARRAEYMIPGTPLTKLLTAQTALMQGDAPKARREFADLLEDDTAAIFGVRGLLNEALSEGNYREALELVRKAEQLQPKRIWVIRTLLDLETRNAEWPKAERTLKKAEKLGIVDKEQARQKRQAIWTAMADDNLRLSHIAVATKLLESAYRLGAGFTPAAVRLAKAYRMADKNRAAFKTIENAWKANPHPDLAGLWMGFMPETKKTKSIYDAGRDTFDWMKRLYDLNPESRDSRRALGAAALQARMWKEARSYLMEADDYRMLAKLERAETSNEAKAREWLEKAADNPPEPRWCCASCNHISDDWQGLCPRCGSFATISWRPPGQELQDAPRRITPLGGGFIAPPATINA